MSVVSSTATGAARLLADAAAAERDAGLRIDAAIADLRLPGPARLSDYQRAAIGRMTERLVSEIESALGQAAAARLGPGAPPELSAAHVALALPRLERAGVLHESALVALLLRRAAEHRMVRRLCRERGPDPIDTLLADPSPEIAAAAAALLEAESRRYDAFQDPAVPRADLSAELHHRLVWTVAAALRADLVERHELPPAMVERALAAAAQGLLAGADEADTLDGRAMEFARTLDRTGGLEDEAVTTLAVGGHVAAAVAALAHRAGIDPAGAWDMALDPAGSRLALLLRAADLGHDAAARVLAAWLAHPRDAGEIAEDLDGVDAAAAHDATALWRLDPGFRAAILALG